MSSSHAKQAKKQKIRFRIRKKIQGTAERPRLVPTISHTKIYLQLIDDTKGHTLLGIAVKGKNMQAAAQAGKLIAAQAKKQKIQNIVFDRAGRRYHGVTKTISQEANKAGLHH